jgi:ABC-type tungstate transport system substrate-binding protein
VSSSINVLKVANDIVHDLAAGSWPGAALALWIARRAADVSLPADQLQALLRGWSSILLIAVVSAVLLVVTGLVRARYRRLLQSTAVTSSRMPVVLAKHAVFVLVFVSATVVAFSSLAV